MGMTVPYGDEDNQTFLTFPVLGRSEVPQSGSGFSIVWMLAPFVSHQQGVHGCKIRDTSFTDSDVFIYGNSDCGNLDIYQVDWPVLCK